MSWPPTVRVHPTALVAESAQIAPATVIGAYVIVEEVDGEAPSFGTGAFIGHHSIIRGLVRIGASCCLDPFSRVGPDAEIGCRTRLLYGARVHEETSIGQNCVIAGNCPDRTTIGDSVVHLGKISHSFYHPFANWDDPAETGPKIGSNVVIGTDANIVGPVTIGNNVFILPREIVRIDIPANSVFRDGKPHSMPNWADYLRVFGRSGWATGGRE